MPTSGRAAVSLSSRHSCKTSQSGTENYQYSRREKTKSSQSYTTRPQRESVPHINTQPPTTSSTQVQRPSTSRAHSAPLVPKSDPTVPEVTNSADDASTGDEDETEEDEEDDEEDEEEEDIADDAFFQRFDSPSCDRPGPLRVPTTPPADPSTGTDCPLSPTSTQMRARPDSTAEPLGSPLSPQAIAVGRFLSLDGYTRLTVFQFPENGTRLQEINIVVLGSPFVGKSAFIQKAFNLQSPPTTAISSRKMSIDGNVYVVRLIELSFNELDLDDESRICWPDSVNGASIPYIDGAFTLYDVMNKESLVQVPETLRKSGLLMPQHSPWSPERLIVLAEGIYNASIPFILVACKCDFPPSHRHVDPYGVEKRAKALIGDITAFQTSQAAPDTQKRCVAVILRAIVSMRNRQYLLFLAQGP